MCARACVRDQTKHLGFGVRDWHIMQMCGQRMPSGERVEWAGGEERGVGGGAVV